MIWFQGDVLFREKTEELGARKGENVKGEKLVEKEGVLPPQER